LSRGILAFFLGKIAVKDKKGAEGPKEKGSRGRQFKWK